VGCKGVKLKVTGVAAMLNNMFNEAIKGAVFL
jgi:hypothetical protein